MSSPAPREAARGGLGRRSIRTALVLLALLGAVWLRARVDGGAALKRGRAAMSEGQLGDAVLHFGRAARWRAPMTGHVEQALEQLDVIGTQAELARDVALALAAQRERRRAILSTRTFAGVAHPEALADANTRIAALMQLEGYDPARAKAELDAPTEGPTPGTLLASLAFFAWLGAVLLLIVRGIEANGAWRRPFAARVGLLALVLLPLWMWLTLRG